MTESERFIACVNAVVALRYDKTISAARRLNLLIALRNQINSYSLNLLDEWLEAETPHDTEKSPRADDQGN